MGETWGPKRTQSLKLAPSDPTMWYRKAINVQLFWHGTGPLRVWGQGAGNEYWGENKVSDVRWCPCSHWDIRGDHLPVTSRTIFEVKYHFSGLPWWLSGKESTCQCRRPRLDPWSREDPLEKEMTTHTSMLVWKIPWTEEPGKLQSMGLQKSQTLSS